MACAQRRQFVSHHASYAGHLCRTTNEENVVDRSSLQASLLNGHLNWATATFEKPLEHIFELISGKRNVITREIYPGHWPPRKSDLRGLDFLLQKCKLLLSR